MSTDALVTVEGLGKVYEPSPVWMRFLLRSAIEEPVVALDDLSFEVRPGEIVAVVGPNGAGKSAVGALFQLLDGGLGDVESVRETRIPLRRLLAEISRAPTHDLLHPGRRVAAAGEAS